MQFLHHCLYVVHGFLQLACDVLNALWLVLRCCNSVNLLVNVVALVSAPVLAVASALHASSVCQAHARRRIDILHSFLRAAKGLIAHSLARCD